MFFSLLTFEIRYWLRQPMVWVFLLINTLLFAWATASDDLTIGGSFGNIYKNAPYVIQNYYAIWSLLALLMTTAFIQNAAIRDFTYQTNQIVFSSPLSKFDYLASRFCGAFLVSLIPFLGISIGSLLGTFMGLSLGATDPDRFGPLIWSAHLNGFLVFAIPNTFITGALMFSLSALTRSTLVAFVGAILLLVAYSIASVFLSNVENQTLAYYVDTFGARPYELITNYWTVSERNTQSVSFSNPMMLLNRLIWIAVSVGLMAYTYVRFSFAERVVSAPKARKNQVPANPKAMGAVLGGRWEPLPPVSQRFGNQAQWAQGLGIARTDFLSTVTSTAFRIILLAGLLNMGAALAYANAGYGLSSYPVTYELIETIRGSMYLILIALIVFYSGMLIWKERDAGMEQLHDALPHRSGTVFLARLAAMIGVVVVILLVCVLAGVITQTIKGYYRYEVGLYLTEFFVIDLLTFIPLIVLSMLVHTLINHKYLAFFVYIALLILNANIWTPLDISSNLVQFNGSPGYRYSDMTGFAPYVASLAWFRTYWLGIAALLGLLTVLFWVRGKDDGWRKRVQEARQRYGFHRVLGAGLVGAVCLLGLFIFYNTNLLNAYQTPKEHQRAQVAYEQTYKQYNQRPQPRIVAAHYAIEVYPQSRKLTVDGDLTLKNKTGAAIDSLHVVLPQRPFHCTVTVDAAHPQRTKLLANDSATVYPYQIYRLSPGLAPGDSLVLHFRTTKQTIGFENEVRLVKQVNQNGSFFDNYDVNPQIGYQPQGELDDRNDRKTYGLPVRERFPRLTRNCTTVCGNSYVNNNADWVRVESTIGTSPDQLAVAPGSLVKEWTKTGPDGASRRYFQYKLEQPSMNFYSFISARYEVARQSWNGIDVEVYYDKMHAYNVKNMAASLKSSLGYYTAQFGRYYHKQARIIEFPRYASFAQAFPGTMPYSESYGFIARIDPQVDVDMVKYVVAHEMAHQWWGHQVVGASMEGATLLSETMAQYSALMVMEQTYGRDRMRRFLHYEVDRYLASRGGESLKEQPLERVVPSQGYIHYRKGSAVMFYFKEMIGAAKVNTALRSLVDEYAYKNPPYPNAYALVARFRQQTPDSLQYLIKDLFETITLFSNRATDARSTKLPNGQYKVTLTVQSEKYRADSLGREAAIGLNDWIDLGVYGHPEPGKKQGKLLAIRREKISRKNGTYEFVVKEPPYEAGIDPLNYLIDRIPDDNLKRIRSQY